MQSDLHIVGVTIFSSCNITIRGYGNDGKCSEIRENIDPLNIFIDTFFHVC